MQARYAMVACVSLLFACAGTSSGNPTDGAGDDLPIGAELVRSDLPFDEDPELSEADAKTFGDGNAAFALDLYRELADAQGPGANLFVSPYSISTALAMTYAGARGRTETEMRDTLHFELAQTALHSAFNATTRTLEGRADELQDDSTGQGFELSIVNQAWGRQGYAFADAYLDVLAQQYGAGMFLVKFGDAEASRTLINDWVLEQTKQRVKDLLPVGAISPTDTQLILTNAIYFKGNWLFQFDPALTEDGTFMADSGARTVPMMHRMVEAQYAETATYQAVALPYLSPAVRMLLVLPAPGQFDGVAQALDGAALAEIRGALSEHSVTLTLPKFSFESENPLKGPLSSLGMPSAFKGADFSGINDGKAPPLHIEEVYHKAFVAVDEEGTEAAAATAVVINDESATPPAVMTLDRPFIFLIYDEPTGQVLFVGHLRDPE